MQKFQANTKKRKQKSKERELLPTAQLNENSRCSVWTLLQWKIRTSSAQLCSKWKKMQLLDT